MTGGTRKIVFGIIIAAGLVGAIVFARNLGLFRRRGPGPRVDSTGVRSMTYRCGRCKHQFVGYEVERVPGSDPKAGQFRYRRAPDKPWVLGTDKRAAAIKAPKCPKCGADLRHLLLLDADALPTGNMPAATSAAE